MLENTVEDCLEILAGFRKESDNFSLMKEDYTIMHSIARQVFKGTALTDRQLALMQKKLPAYKDQFDNADIPLELVKLRKPLRSINREKYIKLQGNKIKIRFINRCMSMKISFTAFHYRLITFNDVLKLIILA